ncbi:MAG: alpha/beta fold hydrolase [Geodermatophilaceae bacterium]|nr:alpha/beta fold hydrolase [Geodermatophilaceae bacterium]
MRSSYCPFDVTAEPDAYGLMRTDVESSFGRLVVYHSVSQTSGCASLLLHGVNSSWTTWTPMLTAAQRDGATLSDVVLVDLPGFGQSENRKDHLRIGDVAGELIAVLVGLGYSTVEVIGHSMGGFLALGMARAHVQTVTSVKLVSGTYFSLLQAVQEPVRALLSAPGVSAIYWSQAFLSRVDPRAKLLRGMNSAGLLRPVISSVFAHPTQLKPGVVDAVCTDFRGESFVKASRNGIGFDARAEWSQVVQPVSAVFGGRDHLVVNRDAERLIDALPHARSETISDAGHFAHIERPFETLRSLRLGQTFGGRHSEPMS